MQAGDAVAAALASEAVQERRALGAAVARLRAVLAASEAGCCWGEASADGCIAAAACNDVLPLEGEWCNPNPAAAAAAAAEPSGAEATTAYSQLLPRPTAPIPVPCRQHLRQRAHASHGARFGDRYGAAALCAAAAEPEGSVAAGPEEVQASVSLNKRRRSDGSDSLLEQGDVMAAHRSGSGSVGRVCPLPLDAYTAAWPYAHDNPMGRARYVDAAGHPVLAALHDEVRQPRGYSRVDLYDTMPRLVRVQATPALPRRKLMQPQQALQQRITDAATRRAPPAPERWGREDGGSRSSGVGESGLSYAAQLGEAAAELLASHMRGDQGTPRHWQHVRGEQAAVARASVPSCARQVGEWGSGAGTHSSPGLSLGAVVSSRGAKLAARAAASATVASFAAGSCHASGVSCLPAAIGLLPDGPAMSAAASRLVDAWASLKPRVHAALKWDAASGSDTGTVPRATDVQSLLV